MLSIRRFGLASRRAKLSGQRAVMDSVNLDRVTNFVLDIADDVLRDLVRGENRDVILPTMVLRRLDAVLEATKFTVLSMKANLATAGITNQDAAAQRLRM
jgi:type I restriction enzyme M protein